MSKLNQNNSASNKMSRRKTDHSDQDSEKFFDARDNNESLKSHTSNIDPEKTKLIIEASKKSIQVPNRLDSFLSGFSSWAGSAYNMDYSLKFLQYLAWALSKVYSSDGMRSFYTQINNTRYIMRLFGAPVSLQAIRTRYAIKPNIFYLFHLFMLSSKVLT